MARSHRCVVASPGPSLGDGRSGALKIRFNYEARPRLMAETLNIFRTLSVAHSPQRPILPGDLWRRPASAGSDACMQG
jgi:hypothetical protein